MDDTTPLTETTLSAGGISKTIEYNIFFLVLFAILILATAVLNLGTLVAFWRLPNLREKPSELLILNLACADLFTGVVMFPMAAPLYVTPGHWPIGESGCKAAVFCLNFGIHGSLFALTTISIDRFLLVFLEYPTYIKTLTRKRVYCVIIGGWVFVLMTIALELGMWDYAKAINITAKFIPFHIVCLSPPRRVPEFSLIVFLLLYFFPVLLVCGLSGAFLYQLKSRLIKTRKSPGASSANSGTKMRTTQVEMRATEVSESVVNDDAPSGIESSAASIDVKAGNAAIRHQRARNRYIKPGITLLSLVTAMAICMLPYCLYVLSVESGCEQCNNPKVLFALLLLQFCNATLDPFIYMMTRKKVRTFWRACFCH